MYTSLQMLCLLAATLLVQREIVVAPNGSDSNAGTASQPVRTIQFALARARATKCHTIVLRAGEYRLTKGLELGSADSDLLIRSDGKGRPLLFGGVEIPMRAVFQCQDQAILGRIVDVQARSRVKTVDLAALGVADLGRIQARGFPQPPREAPAELFADATPMTLARWPDRDYTKVGGVVEPGNGESDRDQPARKPVFLADSDRPKLWSKAEEPWFYGYWKYDWADESIRGERIDPATGAITLARPHVYGVAKGTPFYAENLLEELDRPGEYWIDRQSRKVYFIPPAPEPKRYFLSLLGSPLVTAIGAKRLTVRGIDFALSRGDGAVLRDCEDARLEGCRFFALGGRGAVVEGGHRCGFKSCDIWATGEGGVSLAGGDRQTLQRGDHYVDNCDIHDYERRSQTYRPAVLISGVGNRVSHCAIHDAPHSAIIFSGNDHVIESNEFYRTISRTGDGGVVYTGRDWTARGTEIRDNYFHDNVGQSKWEPAIYIDDLGSGIHAVRNRIERCHWGFLVGGGRDNVIEGNVIVDCRLAFDCDARGLGWGKSMLPTLKERLAAVPYKEEPWRTRYPALPGILDADPLAPRGNELRNNLLVSSGSVTQQMEKAFRDSATLEGNRETSDRSAIPDKFSLGAGLQPDILRRSLR